MSTTECGSSLKNFPFKGWTADQILEKYESVLASRERQITDLSIEMGSINDKINTLIDQVEQYKKEIPQNVFFLGRLGDYKYYDMDKAVQRAIDLFEEIANGKN